MKHLKKLMCILIVLTMITASVPVIVSSDAPQIKNIIFMIPDGGGFGNFDYAAEVKKAGGFNKSFAPNATEITQDTMYLADYLAGVSATRSADNSVTDSAAGGTALSSGYRTKNGYIGIDENRVPKATILEAAQLKGKAVGTVSTYFWSHATPASFSAHNESRYNYSIMSEQVVNQGLDVCLGCGFGNVGWGSINDVVSRGYKVLVTRNDFHNVKPGDKIWGNAVSGDFPYDVNLTATQPTLKDMTEAAITALSGNENGFFVMIEGGKVDTGGHANNAVVTSSEYIAYDEAFKYAVEWASKRNDTVVVSVADHDCGGLIYDKNMLDISLPLVQSGVNPKYDQGITWESTNHTAYNVGVHLYVPEGVSLPGKFSGTLGDNTVNRNTVMNNYEIPLYLAELAGLDIDKASEELFVDVSDIGRYEFSTGKFTFINGGGNKYIYANQSYGYLDGEKVDLDGEVAIYSANHFYVPKRFVTDEDFDVEPDPYGSIYDPIIISSAEDFISFTNTLKDTDYKGKYFLQTGNINLDGTAYAGTSSSNPGFAGIYNGNGYKINCNYEGTSGYSIFGKLSGTIINLGVSGYYGTTSNTATNHIGLVYTIEETGKIVNCYSSMKNHCYNAAGCAWENNGLIDGFVFYGTLDGINRTPICYTGNGSAKNSYYFSDVYNDYNYSKGTENNVTNNDKQNVVDELNANLESIRTSLDLPENYMATWCVHDGEVVFDIPDYSYVVERGTEANPYLITSLKDFMALSQKITSGDRCEGKYYKQTCDINLVGADGYAPIDGSSKTFSGVYDGGGYTLFVDISSKSNTTLFGKLNGKIYNLMVKGSFASSLNSLKFGPVVSSINKDAVVANCYVNADVSETSAKAGAACGIVQTVNGTLYNTMYDGVLNAKTTYPVYAIGSPQLCDQNYFTDKLSGTADGTYAIDVSNPANIAEIMNNNLENAANALGINKNELCEWQVNLDGELDFIDKTPKVTKITVSPKVIELKPGDTYQFEAVAEGTYDFDREVSWTAEGVSSSTITHGGLLTVGLDETANEFYIFAKSQSDGSVSDVATVIVIREDETEVIYGDVTGDDNINIEDVVLLVKYLGLKASDTELDPEEFPADQLASFEEAADVTGDDNINIEDVVLLVKYLGLKASGSELDPADFPNGNFPAANK